MSADGADAGGEGFDGEVTVECGLAEETLGHGAAADVAGADEEDAFDGGGWHEDGARGRGRCPGKGRESILGTLNMLMVG